mmetsp:Transcript_34664/g.73831  ORF Transcript_34664/g.73831 Transcript_34664/m.73831 type:complete len:218 (+) Transcript_34664:766-1419(+)
MLILIVTDIDPVRLHLCYLRILAERVCRSIGRARPYQGPEDDPLGLYVHIVDNTLHHVEHLIAQPLHISEDIVGKLRVEVNTKKRTHVFGVVHSDHCVPRLGNRQCPLQRHLGADKPVQGHAHPSQAGCGPVCVHLACPHDPEAPQGSGPPLLERLLKSPQAKHVVRVPSDGEEAEDALEAYLPTIEEEEAPQLRNGQAMALILEDLGNFCGGSGRK